MYSPNLFTNDVYKLWSTANDQDSIRAFPEFRNGGPAGRNENQNHNGQGQSNRSNGQVLEEQRKYLRLLFAPPLLAYSADYPGASVSQLEYAIKKSVGLSGIEPLGIASALDNTTSPLTQLKLDQLEQITNTGYSTVRPIGINRTLEELDFEDARRFNTSDQGVEDHSDMHTVENSNTEGHGAGVNGSNISREINPEPELDLDAQIANMDEQEENARLEDEGFEDDSESLLGDEGEDGDLRLSSHELYFQQDYRNTFSRHEQTPAPSRGDFVAEGFMADEVEYQDDHSIGAEHNMQLLVNTITSGSSIVSNMNSGRSLGTNLTSIPESATRVGLGISGDRECELPGENSIDDQSDLDMVIEE